MQNDSIHSWDVSPKEAVVIQKSLRNQIRLVPLTKLPRLIAGTDISYAKHSKRHFAAVVILSFPELKIVDKAFVIGQVTFPYVPGLLSFREVPLLLKAFKKLSVMPDLIFCDGQGLSHPRRFGLACHLGLVLDRPAIGVAKSPLFGDCKMPGLKKGSRSPIRDGSEQIGTVLRTRDGVAPIYVSVGNRITLDEAEKWVLACSQKYRIPEPTRQAHIFANELRLTHSQHSQDQSESQKFL